jgi:hypothetical protein
MQMLILSLTAAICIFATSPAFGQQAGGSIAAEQKDIGKIQTRIQKYDQAVGVISQLSRPQSSSVECNGVCYFPNSSRPITWKCEPHRTCDLHCTVNPPVGGCN